MTLDVNEDNRLRTEEAQNISYINTKESLKEFLEDLFLEQIEQA